MSRNGKIMVAMSGGIDSTVAALLLNEEGYEVVGVTMKTWDYASSGGSKKETGCCSLDSINDARNIAVKHGIHHIILDIREEFNQFVVKNFVDEYLVGRTPNPCILCNTHIKWEALLRRADMLDCEFIATGHYARKNELNGRYYISTGIDMNKDQSYVLWGLSQESLARTQFPLGNLKKTVIREMAVARGYDELAKKSESYEICFVPDNDYRNFLKRNVEGIEEKLAGGFFRLEDDTIVGTHRGYPFYTIGQRKKLELALGMPAYVTRIEADSNTVYIGTENDLAAEEMWVGKLNWMKYGAVENSMMADTKIRYKTPPVPSIIKQIGDFAEVRFSKPVHAIAPGQAAVFYEGDDIIGGGWIEKNNSHK